MMVLSDFELTMCVISNFEPWRRAIDIAWDIAALDAGEKSVATRTLSSFSRTLLNVGIFGGVQSDDFLSWVFRCQIPFQLQHDTVGPPSL